MSPKRTVLVAVFLSALAVIGVVLILVGSHQPQARPVEPQVSQVAPATSPPTAIPPTATHYPDIQAIGQQAARSLVQLSVPSDLLFVYRHYGSGSIVDGERGLIVTNWHVVGDRDGALHNERGYAKIYLTGDPDQLPDFTYWAQVLPQYSDPDLDLAILQITHRATDLAPVQRPLDLPAVTLRDNTPIHAGDHVLLLGFPNYAEGRLSWTEGLVATHDSWWIKSDAEVSHGHSGGMMLNQRGELIGIPTKHEETTVGGGLVLARPINLALSLIEAAVAADPVPAIPLLRPTHSTDALMVVLGVDDSLDLWYDPSSSSLVVNEILKGTLVEVLREPVWDGEQFWYYVQVVGGARAGWASGAYLATWEIATSPILFASDRSGNFDIYRILPDGSGLTRLTDDPGDESSPSWSPDHDFIVFTSDRSGDADLYKMEAGGGSWTQLTSDPADDVHPVWSPDGSRIAFVSDRDGDWEIFVINADGTELRQVTSNEAWDDFPAWSPDSARLVYTSRRNGNYDLYLLNLTTEADEPLTTSPYADAHPAWAPEGDKIVYVTVVLEGGALLREIDVLNVHDPEHPQHVISLEPGEAISGCVDWSPDGGWIVFTSERDGNEEIYLAPADGGWTANLTDAPLSSDNAPAWSR